MKRSAAISAFALLAACGLAACGGGGIGGSGKAGGDGREGAGGDTSALAWPVARPAPVSPAPSKPRVILTVMLDDADYQDFGYYSADAVTPNINALAAQGVVLSRYYSAAPICSPTRASVITGNEPARFGLNRLWPDIAKGAKGDYFQGKRGIPAGEETLPATLAAAGYRSLHVGKWHIGRSEPRFLPQAQGFDCYDLMSGAAYSGKMRVDSEDGPKQVDHEWRTAWQAERIMAFIDENLQGDRNIYINWWPVEPHTVPVGKKLYYTPATFDPAAFQAAARGADVDLDTNRGMLVATMFAFDQQFGRVVERLKQKGVFDDSLIVVTSDNGGYKGALSPARVVNGYKETLFEGGIRVPFAASWPKRIAAGSHSDLPVVSTDLYPTITGLIGAPAPRAVDGEDAASVLLSGTGQRQPIYFQVRRSAWRQSSEDRTSDSLALIDGCDKIVQDGGDQQYFNVCQDRAEENDLAASQPERFEALQSALRQRRLKAAEYLAEPSLTAARTLPDDDRLNIHEDDLSVYATVNGKDFAATAPRTVYRRGEGVALEIKGGRLIARITGLADNSAKPSYRTVELSAVLPRDTRDHQIGLVIRGYVFGASTINLYVDGEMVSQLAAPVNTRLAVGDSVLAVKDESVPAQIGDDKLPLRDVRLYVNAIEPDELDVPNPAFAGVLERFDPGRRMASLIGILASVLVYPVSRRVRRRRRRVRPAAA